MNYEITTDMPKPMWNDGSRAPSYSTLTRRFRSMRPKVHVHKINRSWKWSKEAKERIRARKFEREMQAKNMKLYVMNRIIVEENEKLRRKAVILVKENKFLLSQFQKLHRPDSGNTIDTAK